MEKQQVQYVCVQCDGVYLADIKSVLCQLLLVSLWFPTTDEGFKIIQLPVQSTTFILPPGPFLQPVQPKNPLISLNVWFATINTQYKKIIPQENSLFFMYEFLCPPANVHHKPGSSFEKPLPVPGPFAAKLWLWLPAVPARPLDTRMLLALVGTDVARRPTETWGPAEASGSPRDQRRNGIIAK